MKGERMEGSKILAGQSIQPSRDKLQTPALRP